MHCRYFSVSDCSIRVSRSFVQFLCPLHKNCTYYASILLIAFTQPLCQKFCWRNRRVPSCVVVTVIGVSFILKTDLLACLLERKTKFLVQSMTVTQLQQSIISFIFLQMLFSTQKLCWLHPVLISYHK